MSDFADMTYVEVQELMLTLEELGDMESAELCQAELDKRGEQ